MSRSLLLLSLIIYITSCSKKQEDQIIPSAGFSKLQQEFDINYEKGNFEVSQEIAKRQVAFSEQNKDEEGLAKSFQNLGKIYLEKQDYTNSLAFFNKSLGIYDNLKIKDEENIGKTAGNIGNIYYKLCSYSKALLFYEKALSNFTKANAKPLTIAHIYRNIGLSKTKLGKYLEAIKFYELAGDLYKETNQINKYSNILIDIAATYTYLKNYSNALYYNQEALKLTSTYQPDLYNNIGFIYEMQGDYTKALSYFEKSLALSIEMKDKVFFTTLYHNIGQTKLFQKQYKAALISLQKAENIAKIENLEQELIDIYQSLSQAYVGLKEAEKSIFYNQEATNLQKSILEKKELALQQNFSQIQIAEQQANSFLSKYNITDKPSTLPLWLGMAALVLVSSIILIAYIRNQNLYKTAQTSLVAVNQKQAFQDDKLKTQSVTLKEYEKKLTHFLELEGLYTISIEQSKLDKEYFKEIKANTATFINNYDNIVKELEVMYHDLIKKENISQEELKPLRELIFNWKNKRN